MEQELKRRKEGYRNANVRTKSTIQLLDLIDFVFGRHGQLCRVEMMRRESVCVCERERERERR